MEPLPPETPTAPNRNSLKPLDNVTNKTLQSRMTLYSTLLGTEQTPLFNTELRLAHFTFESALRTSVAERDLPHLLKVDDAIRQHWSRLHGNSASVARIKQWAGFIANQLLHNYLAVLRDSRPFDVAGIPEARRHLRHFDDFGTIADPEVGYVRELEVDMASFARILRGLVARGGRWGSEVTPLVDAGQWKELAAMLAQDQSLIIHFTKHGWISDKERRELLAEIQRLDVKVLQPRRKSSVNQEGPPVSRPLLGGLRVTASTSFAGGSSNRKAKEHLKKE